MSLPRATGIIAAADRGGAPDDYVELDFDERHRRRIRMVSAGGRAFLLDLASAVAMRDGDVLELTDGSMIGVRARAEKVAEISAANDAELTRIAWHLGNRHLPTQILADRLRILNDHVIVDMVRGLGATVEIVDAPFQPEGGAYGQGHRLSHGHAHGHAHEHGGEADHEHAGEH